MTLFGVSGGGSRFRRSRFGGRTNPEMAVRGRQAAARLEVELPAVQVAGEDAVADLAEHREIGLPVGTPALQHVARELDLLRFRRGCELPPRLGLRPNDALLGERFE